jgi:hypothetical protein
LISQAEITAGVLILRTGQNHVYILPVRELRGQGVLNDLVELIRRHVRDCRRLSLPGLPSDGGAGASTTAAPNN